MKIKKIIPIILLCSFFSFGYAASVDVPKLPLSVQEEVSHLWLTYSLWESQNLKNLYTLDEWVEYQECRDDFDALFESATLNKKSKALIGFLVYGNRIESIGNVYSTELKKDGLNYDEFNKLSPEDLVEKLTKQRHNKANNKIFANKESRKKELRRLENHSKIINRIGEDNKKASELYEKYKKELNY